MGDPVKLDVDFKAPTTPLLQFKHADLRLQAANKHLTFTSRRNYDGSQKAKNDVHVRAHSEAIDYVSLPCPEHANYMVGVRKAGTNTLQLIPATVLEMAPRVPSEGDARAQLQLDTAESRAEARATLVESFGGKKQKRVLHSRTRYMLSDHALEDVATKVTDAVQKEKDDAENAAATSAAAAQGRLLPPNNLKAETPEGVYPLNQLVLPNERAALHSLYPEFNKPTTEILSKWQLQNRFMPFVLEALETKVRGATGKRRAQTVLALKYLVELLKFYTNAVVRRLPRKRSDLPRIFKTTPEAVLEGFIAKFLSEGGEGGNRLVLSKQKRHLLVMYILAVALHACEYKNLSVDAFATELKMPVKNLKSIVRALGCTMTTRVSGGDASAANEDDDGDGDDTEKADGDADENPSKRARREVQTFVSLKLPLKFRTRRGRGA